MIENIKIKVTRFETVVLDYDYIHKDFNLYTMDNIDKSNITIINNFEDIDNALDEFYKYIFRNCEV